MKALVLFSGGVDSTTCLAMAVEKYGADCDRTIYTRWTFGESGAKIQQDSHGKGDGIERDSQNMWP